MKKQEKNEILIKMVFTVILIGYGLFMEFFLVCVFLIRSWPLPKFIGVVAALLFVPYMGCVYAFAGLGAAISGGGLSSKQMSDEIFDPKKGGGGKKRKENRPGQGE